MILFLDWIGCRATSRAPESGTMKTHDTLIPTRFMSTICFLIATIMVFSTMAENILAALPPNYTEASYSSYNTSFTFALALNLICIGLNLLGFMLGFSMFAPAICVLNIVSHTLGCIYTCVFIMQSWHFMTFWYIWAFFAAPVAVLELCIITGTLCLGSANRV